MLTWIQKGFFLPNRKPYLQSTIVILLETLTKTLSGPIFPFHFPSQMGSMEGDVTLGSHDWESDLSHYGQKGWLVG